MNLPGSTRLYGDKPAPPCDHHPGRKAVAQVQGETDSFGAEYHELCDECLAKDRKARAIETQGYCELCKHDEQPDIRPWRDYEEGFSGPVYNACAPCRRKLNQSLLEDSLSWQ